MLDELRLVRDVFKRYGLGGNSPPAYVIGSPDFSGAGRAQW
jgi:hypothetical protein